MQARIYRGAWDAEGKRLAYLAFGAGYNGLFGGSAGWRGYRGGTTPSIRILDPQKNTVTAIPGRSEEHTSELQSLMRISYAVFCLKKKNNTSTITTYENTTQKQSHTIMSSTITS